MRINGINCLTLSVDIVPNKNTPLQTVSPTRTLWMKLQIKRLQSYVNEHPWFQFLTSNNMGKCIRLWPSILVSGQLEFGISAPFSFALSTKHGSLHMRCKSCLVVELHRLHLQFFSLKPSGQATKLCSIAFMWTSGTKKVKRKKDHHQALTVVTHCQTKKKNKRKGDAHVGENKLKCRQPLPTWLMMLAHNSVKNWNVQTNWTPSKAISRKSKKIQCKSWNQW